MVMIEIDNIFDEQIHNIVLWNKRLYYISCGYITSISQKLLWFLQDLSGYYYAHTFY